MKANVLVTDGHSRASISIIRSLGRKRINVYSGESYRINPSFFSKYVKKTLIYHDPKKHPIRFIDDINNFVEKNKIETIIPVVDDCTLLLSKYKNRFSPNVKIPIANYDTLLVGRDKAKTIELAEKEGIPHPKTLIDDHPDFTFIKRDFEFPVILKPRRSSGSRGIVCVKKPRDLEKEYTQLKKQYNDLIIQEFIPYGGANGVFLLFNQGEPRALFVHKRLREYPPSGGPSTLRESVVYPKIEEYALKILKKLNWHGVAMVEFRIDARDGEPKLMEINPRYWGSLQLGIFAGVDFPYLHYKMALDGDIKPVFNYKLSVKARWFFGDVLWLLSQQQKIKLLPNFLKMREDNMAYDILSVSDPLPAIGSILESIIFMVKKKEYVFQRGWS
jgi:predicted ATP-grasp superfamily ATP-dependent carboligase